MLYNPAYEDSKFDNDSLSSILEYNTLKEAVNADPLFSPNLFLNMYFSKKEESDIIMRASNNKAVGIDKLPNEIFKFETVIDVQHFFPVIGTTNSK